MKDRSKKPETKISRREFIKIIATGGVGLVLARCIPKQYGDITPGQTVKLTDTLPPTQESGLEKTAQPTEVPVLKVKAEGGLYTPEQLQQIQENEILKEKVRVLTEEWVKWWATADEPAISVDSLETGRVNVSVKFDTNEPINGDKALVVLESQDYPEQYIKQPWDFVKGDFMSSVPDYDAQGNLIDKSHGHPNITGMGLFLMGVAGNTLSDGSKVDWIWQNLGGQPARVDLNTGKVLERINKLGQWEKITGVEITATDQPVAKPDLTGKNVDDETIITEVSKSIGKYISDFKEGKYHDPERHDLFVDKEGEAVGLDYYNSGKARELEIGGVNFNVQPTVMTPILVDYFAKEEILYLILGASDKKGTPFVWAATPLFISDDSRYLNRIGFATTFRDNPAIDTDNYSWSVKKNADIIPYLDKARDSQIYLNIESFTPPDGINKIPLDDVSQEESDLYLTHTKAQNVRSVLSRYEGENVTTKTILNKPEDFSNNSITQDSLLDSPHVTQMIIRTSK